MRLQALYTWNHRECQKAGTERERGLRPQPPEAQCPEAPPVDRAAWPGTAQRCGAQASATSPEGSVVGVAGVWQPYGDSSSWTSFWNCSRCS